MENIFQEGHCAPESSNYYMPKSYRAHINIKANMYSVMCQLCSFHSMIVEIIRNLKYFLGFRTMVNYWHIDSKKGQNWLSMEHFGINFTENDKENQLSINIHYRTPNRIIPMFAGQITVFVEKIFNIWQPFCPPRMSIYRYIT